MPSDRNKLAEEAARAHSDLNTLYGVIAILEGGTVSAHCYGATSRIIRACKTESAKCLTRYDRALAKLEQVS